MNKIFSIILILVLLSVSFVIAMPNFKEVINEKSKNGVQIVIPDKAAENGQHVFSLGTAIDPTTGKEVEGIAIVDYRENHAKPTCNNNGICEPGLGEKNSCGDCKGGDTTTDSTCYAFISNGVKWKSQEDYIVDPTNLDGLDHGTIRTIIADAIDEWEVHSGNQMGDEVTGVVEHATIGESVNGQNEIIFADISGSNTIAVTIVWGVYRGPPRDRQIVEVDQVYDDVTWDWSFDGSPGTMDFENIVQHEKGHSFGMDHPDAGCTEETMYASASLGETKKRDLHNGDISGIIDLYA